VGELPGADEKAQRDAGGVAVVDLAVERGAPAQSPDGTANSDDVPREEHG
jgi:hypothetical protein